MEFRVVSGLTIDGMVPEDSSFEKRCEVARFEGWRPVLETFRVTEENGEPYFYMLFVREGDDDEETV